MTEAIDRIAVYAERQKFRNSVYDSALWMWSQTKGYKLQGRTAQELTDFGKEFASESDLYLASSPPTLTVEEIKEITKDYPFELPVEMYELYQRGDGLLPIGLNHPSENSINIYKYYFYFPDEEIPLMSLGESMRIYQVFNEYRENFQRDIDPKWFPISIFEDMLLAVIGSEEQQEHSPVIIFFDSEFIPKIEWLSLTDRLLSWIELREADFKNCTEAEAKEIKKAIYKKYGEGCDGLDWLLEQM
jgi:hypothetical protein